VGKKINLKQKGVRGPVVQGAGGGNGKWTDGKFSAVEKQLSEASPKPKKRQKEPETRNEMDREGFQQTNGENTQGNKDLRGKTTPKKANTKKAPTGGANRLWPPPPENTHKMYH